MANQEMTPTTSLTVCNTFKMTRCGIASSQLRSGRQFAIRSGGSNENVAGNEGEPSGIEASRAIECAQCPPAPSETGGPAAGFHQTVRRENGARRQNSTKQFDAKTARLG